MVNGLAALLSKEAQWKLPYPHKWNCVLFQHVHLRGKCSCLEVCSEISHQLFDVTFCNIFNKISNTVSESIIFTCCVCLVFTYFKWRQKIVPNMSSASSSIGLLLLYLKWHTANNEKSVSNFSWTFIAWVANGGQILLAPFVTLLHKPLIFPY